MVPNSGSKKCSSRAARATLVLAALLLSLGPLGLLQAVAWTGMAFDYSTRYGFAAGLGRTFDGKHPCPLCKEITKARQNEKESKAAVTLSPVKLVCVLAATPEVSSAGAPRGEHTYPLATVLFAERTDRPALPPPRTLAA
ncbi:MAG: hypothetical protein FGM15_12120 [Chthoniobacterales bacterium]|nr:hypothetical protein [Chthoniobacterales bacterium]